MAKVQSKIFIFVYLLMMVGYCWGRFLVTEYYIGHDYCSRSYRGFYFVDNDTRKEERHDWARDKELLCNYSKNGNDWLKKIMCNHYPKVDRTKHYFCVDVSMLFDDCYDIEHIEC